MSSALDGFQSRCKECAKAVATRWNKDNAEKHNAHSKEWRNKNLDSRREQNALYMRIYRKENYEQIKIQKMKRRARKLAAEGSYTKEDISNLYIEQEGKCYYCKIPMEIITIDHKIPLTRGGSNYKENLALSCPTCNSRKHTKTDLEFLEGVK